MTEWDLLYRPPYETSQRIPELECRLFHSHVLAEGQEEQVWGRIPRPSASGIGGGCGLMCRTRTQKSPVCGYEVRSRDLQHREDRLRGSSQRLVSAPAAP